MSHHILRSVELAHEKPTPKSVEFNLTIRSSMGVGQNHDTVPFQ